LVVGAVAGGVVAVAASGLLSEVATTSLAVAPVKNAAIARIASKWADFIVYLYSDRRRAAHPCQPTIDAPAL
jgi:hypothetical protein